MPQVIRSPQTGQDLIDILVQIGRHNPAAASRFAAEVDQKSNLLAQFPGMWTACEELAPGLRWCPVGKYLLFYRSVDNGIEIIRVLHGARDISALFNP
jgi:toxin ParE1/3/4